MNNTPQHLRKKWDGETGVCARRKEGDCSGRITKEHAFLYAGKQIQEEWAIIDLCWYHHLDEGLDKKLNECIALRKATINDLKKYPRKPWLQMRQWCETQK